MQTNQLRKSKENFQIRRSAMGVFGGTAETGVYAVTPRRSWQTGCTRVPRDCLGELPEHDAKVRSLQMA